MNIQGLIKGGKRKALIVGISDYSSLQKLDFCKKDGREVYEILSSLGYEISGNNKLIGEVNGEKLKDETVKSEVAEPIYGKAYLPRKFKIAIAIPPNNDVDVFGNDIGLIAIVENNKLEGFNVAIGGGLSTTHGNPETYARLGTVIGFVSSEEKTLKAIYEILTVQRDYGNRSDRKLARLKYTIDRMGVDTFTKEVEKRTDFKFKKARPYIFNQRSDYYGWYQNDKGNWYYTVFVENGRVLDDEQAALKSALLEVAKTGKANFRFTTNQNVIISDVDPKDKNSINQILGQFKLFSIQKAHLLFVKMLWLVSHYLRAL